MNLRSFVPAALALMVVATPALSQASADGVSDRTARALEEEAREHARTSTSYELAADLYRKAAFVRGAEDREAIRDLREAASLAFYAGEHRQAVEDLERAGDMARDLELPSEALESYYEAAWVAQNSEQYATAYRLAQRIAILSRDPDFVADASPAVLARIAKLRAAIG